MLGAAEEPDEGDGGGIDVKAVLEALDAEWGAFYEISHDGVNWGFRRRDGLGDLTECGEPEGLVQAMRDDFLMHRVPAARIPA